MIGTVHTCILRIGRRRRWRFPKKLVCFVLLLSRTERVKNRLQRRVKHARMDCKAVFPGDPGVVEGVGRYLGRCRVVWCVP